MKYKIIIGVVIFCLLAGGGTAAGILLFKNKNKSSASPPPSPPSPPRPPPSPPRPSPSPPRPPSGASGPYLYAQPPFSPKEGFEAMWWDEFDVDFDRSKWYVQPDVIDYYSSRGDLQHYIDDPSTVSVSDGTLSIAARNPGGVQYDKEKSNYDQTYYTSARINTNSTGGRWNPGMFVDGSTWSTIRIESRIRNARGPGILNAFWLQPVKIDGCNGEIDIMETPRCNDVYSGSWVTNGYSQHKYGFGEKEKYDRFCDNYVVYAVEWSAESISFYVDDKLIGTTDVGAWYGKCSTDDDPLAPYANDPFFIILNVPIGTVWSGVPQNDIFPATMSVDYVRVSGIRG